jgi:hypothetical protein
VARHRADVLHENTATEGVPLRETYREYFARERERNARARRYVTLRAATGTLRTSGDYLVVPVVALQEGVITAANATGPEFVPLATLASEPSRWNHKPVTLGHPTLGGTQISAHAPTHGFGEISNTRIQGRKLCMDVLIDPARAARVGARRLLERLRAGEICEVSIGAFVTVDHTPGMFNGQRYDATWKTLSPDHLAFVERGACSVAAGCGTRAAELSPLGEPTMSHDLIDATLYTPPDPYAKDVERLRAANARAESTRVREIPNVPYAPDGTPPDPYAADIARMRKEQS